MPCQARPCPAAPRHAGPCRAMPCLPCPAMPCWALPYQAAPGLANHGKGKIFARKLPVSELHSSLLKDTETFLKTLESKMGIPILHLVRSVHCRRPAFIALCSVLWFRPLSLPSSSLTVVSEPGRCLRTGRARFRSSTAGTAAESDRRRALLAIYMSPAAFPRPLHASNVGFPILPDWPRFPPARQRVRKRPAIRGSTTSTHADQPPKSIPGSSPSETAPQSDLFMPSKIRKILAEFGMPRGRRSKIARPATCCAAPIGLAARAEAGAGRG